MRSLKEAVTDFVADETGATAIEYALIASGIALAIVASINAIANALNGVFDDARTAVE